MNLQQILEDLPYMSNGDLVTLHDAIERQLGRLGNNRLTSVEQAELDANNLIGCVKLIRESTGLGLRDAKNIMDRARGI